MLHKLLEWCLLGFVSFLSIACTTTKQNDESQINPKFVIIETPFVVDEADQMRILKLSQLINSPNIDNVERSKLFFSRAVLYDRIGMAFLATLSLMAAIQENNELADAYSYLGILYAVDGKYLEAYDAFDAALELAPRVYSTYLNRGISLYYGHRSRSAHEDLDKYYQQNIQDPYRIIWLYIVEKSMNMPSDKEKLLQRFRLIAAKDSLWINKLIEVILGLRTEEDFWSHLLEWAEKESNPETLCEAYFYLGKYHQLQGHEKMASDYFKLSIMTNVTYFMEYRFALIELKNMNQSSNGQDIITTELN